MNYDWKQMGWCAKCGYRLSCRCQPTTHPRSQPSRNHVPCNDFSQRTRTMYSMLEAWIIRAGTVPQVAMPATSRALLAIVRNSPASRNGCITWLRRNNIAHSTMSVNIFLPRLNAASPTSLRSTRPRTARAFCSVPRSLQPHASHEIGRRRQNTVCLIYVMPTMPEPYPSLCLVFFKLNWRGHVLHCTA